MKTICLQSQKPYHLNLISSVGKVQSSPVNLNFRTKVGYISSKFLYGILCSFFILFIAPLSAQSKSEEYNKVIQGRAEKIVGSLNISDAKKASQVQEIIASQYKDLSSIQNERDSKIKEARQSGNNKEAVAAAVKNIEDDAAANIDKLHKSYVHNLSKKLTSEQVDKVKDGMTYNVVNITYDGYLQMIPELTDAQKVQIKAWLVEAREHAMDAETSEKKHGWFGKYKGRINNYLSAAGYDLKKAGEDWEKRRNENKQAKNTQAIN